MFYPPNYTQNRNFFPNNLDLNSNNFVPKFFMVNEQPSQILDFDSENLHQNIQELSYKAENYRSNGGLREGNEGGEDGVEGDEEKDESDVWSEECAVNEGGENRENNCELSFKKEDKGVFKGGEREKKYGRNSEKSSFNICNDSTVGTGKGNNKNINYNINNNNNITVINKINNCNNSNNSNYTSKISSPKNNINALCSFNIIKQNPSLSMKPSLIPLSPPKKGRKPKYNKSQLDSPPYLSKINRTKTALDNMIIKIKVKFLESMRNLINEMIVFEGGKSNYLRYLQLKKLGKKFTGNISMKETKDFLFKKTMKEFYKESEISLKFKYAEKNENKEAIEKIEKNVDVFPLCNIVLNLKGEEAYDLFLRAKFSEESKRKVIERLGIGEEDIVKIEEIAGGCLSGFWSEIWKMREKKEDEEYIKLYEDTAENKFIDYYTKGKTRNREKKEEKDNKGKEKLWVKEKSNEKK